MEQIAVYLTQEETEKFKEFSKHYDLFITLQQKGIFEIKFGKCTLNFANGVLQNVIKEEVVWKR